MDPQALDGVSSDAFRLEPVFLVHVELGPRDDDRIRAELATLTGLRYGDYDRVAFEGAEGTQFCRAREGAKGGPAPREIAIQGVRILSFSLPRDAAILTTALETIHRLHSYEEPVVYVREAHATRAIPGRHAQNPHKWWNRAAS